MKKFKAIATMTTYAQIDIMAADEQAAYDIADAMDGGEFVDIAGEGGWSIEILPAD